MDQDRGRLRAKPAGKREQPGLLDTGGSMEGGGWTAEEGPTDKEADAHSSSRDPTSASLFFPLDPRTNLLGQFNILGEDETSPVSNAAMCACLVTQSCPAL